MAESSYYRDNRLICEEKLSDDERKSYGNIAQKTLIRCSDVYGDAVATVLETLVGDEEKVVHIHVKCYTAYTHKRNIQKVNIPLSPKKKVLRSNFPDFDFKRKCFLCGENADVQSEKKKEIGKRDVQVVRSFRTEHTIQNATVTRSDEWGTDVARRMSTIGDLIAAEARYHHTKCYIPFTNKSQTRFHFP